MFWGPGPLEFGFSTCFNSFSPSLTISHSTCLHQSRCIGAGGTSDRSLWHGGLLGRSLLWRSGSRPNTRPTWAYHGAFGPPVQLLSGLAWLRLRPPGQWCPNQMGALLDLVSFNEQPMEVAPSFDPEGELREIVQMEASSPMELLSDIWHVVQRGLLLNSNHLSLSWGEVVEEAFPSPSPLCLPKGGLHRVFVVDLEHMLKVPSPPTAAVFCCHLGQIRASRPGTMAGLELGISLGGSRGSIGFHPLASSGATD